MTSLAKLASGERFSWKIIISDLEERRLSLLFFLYQAVANESLLSYLFDEILYAFKIFCEVTGVQRTKA